MQTNNSEIRNSPSVKKLQKGRPVFRSFGPQSHLGSNPHSNKWKFDKYGIFTRQTGRQSFDPFAKWSLFCQGKSKRIRPCLKITLNNRLQFYISTSGDRQLRPLFAISSYFTVTIVN